MVKRFLKIKETNTAIILKQLHNCNYMLIFHLVFSCERASKPKKFGCLAFPVLLDSSKELFGN